MHAMHPRRLLKAASAWMHLQRRQWRGSPARGGPSLALLLGTLRRQVAAAVVVGDHAHDACSDMALGQSGCTAVQARLACMRGSFSCCLVGSCSSLVKVCCRKAHGKGVA